MPRPGRKQNIDGRKRQSSAAPISSAASTSKEGQVTDQQRLCREAATKHLAEAHKNKTGHLTYEARLKLLLMWIAGIEGYYRGIKRKTLTPPRPVFTY